MNLRLLHFNINESRITASKKRVCRNNVTRKDKKNSSIIHDVRDDVYRVHDATLTLREA